MEHTIAHISPCFLAVERLRSSKHLLTFYLGEIKGDKTSTPAASHVFPESRLIIMAAMAVDANTKVIVKPGSELSSSWQYVSDPHHVPLSHQQSDQTLQPKPTSGICDSEPFSNSIMNFQLRYEKPGSVPRWETTEPSSPLSICVSWGG